MPISVQILQAVINGLLIGGVYALIAVGLTMIFGVMRIINFAQGDFLMVGMYVTWLLFRVLNVGVPYWLIPLVAVIMFGLGSLVFRTTIIRVIGKGDSNYIVLTLGISYLLQYGVQMIFSPNFQNLPVSNQFRQSAIHWGGYLTIMLPQLIAFAVALVFVIAMSYFLGSTDMGRAMRATSEDNTIAALLGVNTKVIYTVAFSLGIVFAGISGLLLSPIYSINPRSGVLFSTIAMAVVVLGGLGNIKGAMIGGLLIGLVQSFFGTFTSMDIAQIAIDTSLIAVLMFRPFGLFGGGARKA